MAAGPDDADLDAMVRMLNDNGFDPENKTTVGERRNYLAQQWNGDTAKTVSTIINTYYNVMNEQYLMDEFMNDIRRAPEWRAAGAQLPADFVPPPPPQAQPNSASSTPRDFVQGGEAQVEMQTYPTDEEAWASDNRAREDDNREFCCTWDPRGVCDDIRDLDTGIQIMCCGLWTLIIVILAIILIACSVETIDSTEMGIAYNAPQAILSPDVKEEGLHAKPPFGYYILWPRTHQTLQQTVSGMSKDGVVVSVEVAFQYKIIENELMRLTMDYKDVLNYQKILKLKSRSGIRNACMKYMAQEFQTKRAALQQAMTDDVNTRLTEGGMQATMYDLQLTKVDRPPTYELAVDAKENAKNQIDLVINKKQQQITSATTAKMRVIVEANKTIDAANTAALVLSKNAQIEAAIVYGKYESQGAMYKTVRYDRNLTSEGLLSYIGTRLIDELSHITVGIAAPARVSYGTALSNVTSRV